MEDEKQDIRWKQRFVYFSKAYKLLEQTIAIKKPPEAERAGLIQFFKTAFELGWKVLKDNLEEKGFMPKSPRETIKLAFQSGLIMDLRLWMEALKDRNLTVHTYEEKNSYCSGRKDSTILFPGF